MTDRELMHMANRIEALAFEMKAPNAYTPRFIMLANEIREALRARLAQPEQEPVACVQDLDEVKRKHLVYEKGMDWKDPLYTAPPQREWEGLTQDERMSIINKLAGQDWVYVIDAIEAKLKEKNGF